jgi:threonine/homoserine/homoserine lactone efflux protein
MPDPDAILGFMAVALALNITPGPDMLYVISRSVGEGRAAGIASALGIGAGTLVHITALALGVSALLATVPFAYDAVRWAGALYLVWLGVRVLSDDGSSMGTRRLAPASLSTVFWQGALTNVLNPKVALFFLALLPQFVDPERGSAAMQIALLVLLFNCSGTLVNVAVALGATALRARLTGRGQGNRLRILRRLPGIVFIGLGVRLAVTGLS